MTETEINVCLTSDNNYAKYMYITIFSLLYNLNKKIKCNTYILDYKLNENIKKLFLKLQKEFKNCKILFIPVDENKYKKYPPFGGYRNTYFRLDIPQLLPNVKKVLYLDPDIIVNSDISDMYNIDINGFAIGAPTETKRSFVNHVLLKIPSDYGFFNAGVLLMNLDYFRENNISEQLFNYLSNTKNIICCDQDALNFILYNKRKDIPRIYNVTPQMKYSHLLRKEKTAIAHFCGNYKPRGRYCTHPCKNLFGIYQSLSGLSIENTEDFSFKKWIGSIRLLIEDSALSLLPRFSYYSCYLKHRLSI